MEASAGLFFLIDINKAGVYLRKKFWYDKNETAG